MTIDRSTLPEITEKIKEFWQPQRTDYSSGGVAYRNAPADDPNGTAGLNNSSRIALIATHNGQRWQLPKGTVEPQETSIQTALREVEEETGLQTAYQNFVETVEYWYWDTYNRTVPMLVHKKVDFYLLKVTGGELSDLSIEVDAVAWFTPEQALQRMTFPAEMDTLRKAMG